MVRWRAQAKPNDMRLLSHQRTFDVKRLKWFLRRLAPSALIRIVLAAMSAQSVVVTRAMAQPKSAPQGNVSSVKHLLLDSRIVGNVTDAALVLGSVTKHQSNPLFVMDKPWEITVNNLYPNVIFDEKDRLYRCWYLVYGSGRYDGLCYAESEDGIRWRKPSLGLVDFGGSTENNLVCLEGAHGVGILLDRREVDPARRFKMFFNIIGSDRQHGPMGVRFSSDGIHWSKASPCPEIQARGDTHNNAFWAPTLSRYVGITRTIRKESGKAIRQVAWTSSEDFLKWSKCKVILEGTEAHLQTYSMPVFHYAGVYVGLPAILDAKTRRVQTELAWSPDTVNWHRICPGTPIIPNAPTEGGYDWGMVFGAVCPILQKDKVLLCYAGGRLPHRGKYDAGLCLATLRPDGFAGYEPKEKSTLGLITTKPVTCTGSRLTISADANGGQVRVVLVDAEGQSVKRSEPVRSDVTDAVVAWQGKPDLAEHVGKEIRLRFELKNARIYSFSFLE